MLTTTDNNDDIHIHTETPEHPEREMGGKVEETRSRQDESSP